MDGSPEASRATGGLVERRSRRGWWAYLIWLPFYLNLAIRVVPAQAGVGTSIALVALLIPIAAVVVQWIRPTLLGWIVVIVSTAALCAYSEVTRLAGASVVILVAASVAAMLPGWPGRTSQETASPKAHTGEEFGRPPSSQMVSASAVPGRMAATTQVILDGVVERESGVTPGPPRTSIRTAVVVLIALFVVGLLLAFLILHFGLVPVHAY